MKEIDLVYGENPHQIARWHQSDHPFLKSYTKLSFNDLQNLQTAYAVLRNIREPAALIVKHANIVGASTSADFAARLQEAYYTDARAAVNGLFVTNQEIGTEELAILETLPFDGIAATSFPVGKSRCKRFTLYPQNLWKWIDEEMREMGDGSRIVQTRFRSRINSIHGCDIYGYLNHSDQNINRILMAWRIICAIKTNAAVIVKGSCTYAVAAGHQDGVTAIEHAIYKARNHCSHSHDTRFKGAVLAADGNFPNDIPVDQIKESGIDCFILPGNAANDDILVKQMLEIGCTVLFTRERCFQH